MLYDIVTSRIAVYLTRWASILSCYFIIAVEFLGSVFFMAHDGEKASPPQYQKVPRHGVNSLSFDSRPSSSDQKNVRKTKVLDKIGTWNSIIVFVGSLVMFVVLAFLWFLVRYIHVLVLVFLGSILTELTTISLVDW